MASTVYDLGGDTSIGGTLTVFFGGLESTAARKMVDSMWGGNYSHILSLSIDYSVSLSPSVIYG